MNIPVLSPSKTLYRTTLSPQAVADKLTSTFNAPKNPSSIFELFRKDDPQYYKGYVNAPRFSMNRSISYTNSFLPITNGTIQSNGKGSNVEIKTNMNILGKIGLLAFTLILIGYVIFSFTQDMVWETENGPEQVPLWIFSIAFLPVLVIFSYAHYVEVNKTRKFLSELLQAEAQPLT